jgi:glycosyltransferase involved in cell wall biosynthesis
MTLAVLSSSYPRAPQDSTNAGVFVRDLAVALHARGERVAVFTHRKGEPGRYAEPFPVREYRWLGRETSLTAIDLTSPAGMVRAASLMAAGSLAYLRFCRATNVTRALACWAVPSGVFAWIAKRRLGVPYAVWALGSDVWRYQRHRLALPLLRRVLADADHRFADGLELARRVTAVCGKPCAYLPSARDLSSVTPGAVDDDRPRPRFLFVGRWEENKGPDVLIEAAARYAQAGGRGSFDLFGEGSLASAMAGRIADLGLGGRVRLHGAIGPADFAGRLAWCDFLVIPSRIESVPVVFSDALQRGAPVLATDVGDLGDLVRDLAVGRVVPPEDPDAMARALRELDDVDSRAFAAAARAAAERFRVPGIAEEFFRRTGWGPAR